MYAVYASPMMQTEVSFMFSPGWHQATHLGLGIDGDEEQVLVAVATLVVGQHLMRVWPLASQETLKEMVQFLHVRGSAHAQVCVLCDMIIMCLNWDVYQGQLSGGYSGSSLCSKCSSDIGT